MPKRLLVLRLHRTRRPLRTRECSQRSVEKPLDAIWRCREVRNAICIGSGRPTALRRLGATEAFPVRAQAISVDTDAGSPSNIATLPGPMRSLARPPTPLKVTNGHCCSKPFDRRIEVTVGHPANRLLNSRRSDATRQFPQLVANAAVGRLRIFTIAVGAPTRTPIQ